VLQDLDLAAGSASGVPFNQYRGPRQEVAMDIVHPRVAGIDVHKKIIWVAVRLPGERPGERALQVKRFATFWRPLQQMAAWLAGLGVTDVAMESTGVYWWPVYHALAAAGVEVCVCNAAHMRNVPGRKTDLRDCQWIAELHEHGCCGPVSSRPPRSRRCGSGPGTARSSSSPAAASCTGWPRCWKTAG
jgi:Transposase